MPPRGLRLHRRRRRRRGRRRGQPRRVRPLADRAADAARRLRARHLGRALRPPPARPRSCSRRSACSSWRTATRTSPSPARPRAEGVPMVFSNQASTPMEACAAELGDEPALVPALLEHLGRARRELRRPRRGAAGARRSWSRSTRRCSAGAPATSTSPTCRSCAARGSPSTRATPSSGGSSRTSRRPAGRRAPAAAAQRWRALGTLIQVLAQLPRTGFCRACAPAWRAARSSASSQIYSRPSLTWDDLPFLRERTELPILLKGDPAPGRRRAARSTTGMDGIVVSNHGGRQVDGAIATLDALPGDRRRGRRRVPIAARQRRPRRRRRLQGAGARRDRGLHRPPLRLRAGDRGRGGRARGDPELRRRVRPDDGAGRAAARSRRSGGRHWRFSPERHSAGVIEPPACERSPSRLATSNP